MTPRHLRRWIVACSLLLTPAMAGAQESYTDWTASMPASAAFDLGALSGAVSIANTVNWGGSLLGIGTSDGLTNYPDTWFSPTAPPVGTEWLIVNANNAVGGSTGAADLVVTFSSPVVNPRIHFVNLDNATVDFAATTNTGGGAVSVTRLSGNPEFEVAGTVANATPAGAANGGCESAAGTNPNGGCGTVQLDGAYLSVTLTVTDTNTATGGGDGFRFTVSGALPAPFVCTGEAFVVQGGSAQLTQIDQTTSPFTFVPIGGPAGFTINNIGFRRADGLIWGSRSSQIVQIDATGATFSLGLPAGLPGGLFNAGDVSVDSSTLYLNSGGGGTLYRVALPALTVTSVPITGDGGSVVDWAAHPSDGLLYGGDAGASELAMLDPATGVRTDVAVPGLTGAGGFGGAWFNAAGTLFLYNNAGTIFEVDLAGPTIVSSQPGPSSSNNDGAACVQDLIGAAKQITAITSGLPATITLDYTFESFSGTEDLFALAADDDLTAVFGTPGVDWTFTSIVSAPAAFANPGFDGDTDSELINQAPAQDLAAGATASITVTIELLTLAAADPNGDFCNQILATGSAAGGGRFGDLSTDGTDPDPDGNTSPDERVPSCINQNGILAPPGFTKVFAPDTIPLGGISTLTFTVDNTANAAAVGNLAFVDPFPAGILIASPPNTVNTCGGTLIAAGGSPIVSLMGGSVPASSTCAISVDVEGTAVGVHLNTTSDLTSEVGNSGPASDTLTVIDQADLSLDKVAEPDPVHAGDTLTYTQTVANAGPSDAHNVQVTETLPAGVTLVETIGCLNDPGGVPVCDLGTVIAGTSLAYVVIVTVETSTGNATLTNLASVASSTPDPTPGNDVATVDTEVQFVAIEVPALGPLGLVMMALLLAALGGLLVHRRR